MNCGGAERERKARPFDGAAWATFVCADGPERPGPCVRGRTKKERRPDAHGRALGKTCPATTTAPLGARPDLSSPPHLLSKQVGRRRLQPRRHHRRHDGPVLSGGVVPPAQGGEGRGQLGGDGGHGGFFFSFLFFFGRRENARKKNQRSGLFDRKQPLVLPFFRPVWTWLGCRRDGRIRPAWKCGRTSAQGADERETARVV